MLCWKGGCHYKDGNEANHNYVFSSIFGKKPCWRFVKGNISEGISDKAEYITTHASGCISRYLK